VSGGTLREREAVREAMLKTGPKVVENSISDLIFIWHVQSEELAKELKEETEKHNPSGKEIRIIEAGPVIGTHVGEGSIAYMYVGDYKKEWLLNS
ncbi:MAG: DegV family protein, partial [Asgard group archaeon]|nr:DegV family protein [Asgard group archaeon]